MKIPVKRWRGYYRALKRREDWAVKFSKLSPFNQLFTWTYRDEMLEAALKNRSWILDAISKEQTTSWTGTVFLAIPEWEYKKDEQK